MPKVSLLDFVIFLLHVFPAFRFHKKNKKNILIIYIHIFCKYIYGKFVIYVYVCIYACMYIWNKSLESLQFVSFFAWLTNEFLSSPYFWLFLLILYDLLLKKLCSFIIFINIKVVIEFL